MASPTWFRHRRKERGIWLVRMGMYRGTVDAGRRFEREANLIKGLQQYTNCESRSPTPKLERSLDKSTSGTCIWLQYASGSGPYGL